MSLPVPVAWKTRGEALDDIPATCTPSRPCLTSASPNHRSCSTTDGDNVDIGLDSKGQKQEIGWHAVTMLVQYGNRYVQVFLCTACVSCTDSDLSPDMCVR
jgi:hypothetical protein